ncbi:ephrin type-A receptor 7-like isoform X1 [Acipenser oxyrinchus oxyrinchus]|uniref:Ephrin type-A receptor 7-like isoform X1 n=1 Tax=Acipenser oxyrinchus oxyrinchus TaxID=40147 RepID=A0AAD8FQS5_ACIOX|nr:ephrin type-A receptor 7-like isoform X1 [Acipenser oxyrinchus oxyrinchus]
MSRRQQECFPCPEHSYTQEEGSTVCHCEEAYYRTAQDSPSSACTRPPSAPVNPVYSMKQSTVIIEWGPPEDSGGRGDVSYSIVCSRCSGPSGQCEPCGSSVGFVPQQTGLVDRTVTVVNLLPHTNYTFQVESLNGVSGLSPWQRQYAQINVSTSLAGKWNFHARFM